MKKNKIEHYSDKEALDFHTNDKSGKIEIVSSKPVTTKRDLALAYSPGVAAPVKAIANNPELAYEYTTKGNLVAVISNGSAILGLGNLGAIASKPVMEGKAVLFKRFADIDSIDLEIDTEDTKEIINSIKHVAKSFGGINLEDIAAPNCFIIEEELKKILDIPVFHDDQHGTAIITTAALINAVDIAKKNLKKISYTNFNFKVNISKQKYIRMIRERYISCLLNMSNKEINLGISEIKSKYKNQIKFTDTLKCISYRK